MLKDEETEFKIVIIGSAFVGKTALVTQSTQHLFTEESNPTLGASFVTKLINYNSINYRLQLWDTAGQERFRGMTPLYFRGSDAAIIVYSVDEPKSFEEIDQWVQTLRDNTDKATAIVLVSNKIDMHPLVSDQMGETKAELIGAHFIKTSAKTGQGVDDLFTGLPRLIQEHRARDDAEHQIGVVEPVVATKKSCC